MKTHSRVLLLGGGHANIQVLHALAKLDQSGFQLTLISEQRLASYSGMLPSYLAGQYAEEELHFDLQALCQRFGFEFVQAKAVEINAAENWVRTEDGAQTSYDICSVNIGIVPETIPENSSSVNTVIYLKPISDLIQKWKSLVASAAGPFDGERSEQKNWVIIGGGAGAFEVAVACRRRFPSPLHKITLVSGQHGLLSQSSLKAQRLARESLQTLNIEIAEGVSVRSIENNQVMLTDGKSLKQEVVLIGTSAAAPEIFQRSGLPTDPKGFVRVQSDLRIKGCENIFAAGDCCHFETEPLPKAGVFAVREGPILAQNIAALLAEKRPLKLYRPQKNFLSILVCGDQQAIACYKSWAVRSSLAWKLKDFIDRRFMAKFR